MLLCRAEQQRNEALLNAEELTRAFKKFKEKATEKIEKVRDFFLCFCHAGSKQQWVHQWVNCWWQSLKRVGTG